MPAKFDRCVKHLIADPKFKPKKKGQSKKDAAYAVCTARFKKKHGMTPQKAKKKGMAKVILDHLRLTQIVRKAYEG